MTAPQISTDTLLASIDAVIENARNDRRGLAALAATRRLTDDERAEMVFLARTINHQQLTRDRILAS